jgi:hypothetical protein
MPVCGALGFDWHQLSLAGDERPQFILSGSKLLSSVSDRSLGEETKLSLEKKEDGHSNFTFSYVSLASCTSSTIVHVATAFYGRSTTLSTS